MLDRFVVPGSGSWRQCCGASWAFILLLAAAVLIGASFHTLSPTEMGLNYDAWTCRVNDKVLFDEVPGKLSRSVPVLPFMSCRLLDRFVLV